MISPSHQVENRLIIPGLELIRINRTFRLHDLIMKDLFKDIPSESEFIFHSP
jgi:hypothetical protein